MAELYSGLGYLESRMLFTNADSHEDACREFIKKKGVPRSGCGTWIRHGAKTLCLKDGTVVSHADKLKNEIAMPKPINDPITRLMNLKKPKAHVGIDPGISKAALGAAALIHSKGYEYFDWTNEKDVAEKFRAWHQKYNIQLIAIERQWGRRGSSMQNVSKLMENYGIWKGFILLAGLKYIDPTPGDWQKGRVFKLKDQDIKEAYTAVARTVFPDADLRFAKHHGRAAALLIADYCKTRASMELRRIQ